MFVWSTLFPTFAFSTVIDLPYRDVKAMIEYNMMYILIFGHFPDHYCTHLNWNAIKPILTP